MVQNPGKTLCFNTLKPVNIPEPLWVKEDPCGLPGVVGLSSKEVIVSQIRNSKHEIRKKFKIQKSNDRNKFEGTLVAAIDDRWRVDDEWWRSEPISRLYYAVRLASGQRLVLYKDLVSGGWYRQGY